MTERSTRIGWLPCGCVVLLDGDGDAIDVVRPCADYPDDCPSQAELMAAVIHGATTSYHDRMRELAGKKRRLRTRNARLGKGRVR